VCPRPEQNLAFVGEVPEERSFRNPARAAISATVVCSNPRSL